MKETALKQPTILVDFESTCNWKLMETARRQPRADSDQFSIEFLLKNKGNCVETAQSRLRKPLWGIHEQILINFNKFLIENIKRRGANARTVSVSMENLKFWPPTVTRSIYIYIYIAVITCVYVCVCVCVCIRLSAHFSEEYNLEAQTCLRYTHFDWG